MKPAKRPEPREDESAELTAILQDLVACGAELESLQHLHLAGAVGRRCLPVAISWLGRVKTGPATRLLVRALGLKGLGEAAGEALVAAFHRTEDAAIRWSVGSALETLAEPTTLP